MLRLARWLMLVALSFTLSTADDDVPAITPPANCSTILPYFELDNGGVSFDTQSLFHFVALLGSYIEREEDRALVANVRESCGLEAPSSHVRPFRAACYMLERSFMSHRRPLPSVVVAENMEEAAVFAALALARNAMLREPGGCFMMCPCAVGENECPLATHDGECVLLSTPAPDSTPLAAAPEEPVQTDEGDAMEPEETSEATIVALSIPHSEERSSEVVPTITPTPSMSETPAPSASGSPTATPSTSSIPLPSLTPSPSASPSESEMPAPTDTTTAVIAETIEPIAFSGEEEEVPLITPVPGPLSNSESSLSGTGLSMPAMIGMIIGGVVLISAVAIVAVQQIAFRRRHAEEIEQWRNAFRVVEN